MNDKIFIVKFDKCGISLPYSKNIIDIKIDNNKYYINNESKSLNLYILENDKKFPFEVEIEDDKINTLIEYFNISYSSYYCTLNQDDAFNYYNNEKVKIVENDKLNFYSRKDHLLNILNCFENNNLTKNQLIESILTLFNYKK
jgi:hypothetical protein